MAGNPPSWIEFISTGVVPDFPERGLYPQWDGAWNPTGLAATPHHKGQPPIKFPRDWSSMMILAAERSKQGTIGE
jgi:hypothetical protein